MFYEHSITLTFFNFSVELQWSKSLKVYFNSRKIIRIPIVICIVFQTQMYSCKDFYATYKTISVGGTAFVFGGVGEEMGKIQECLNYKTKGFAYSVMWGTLVNAEYCLKYLTSSTMCKYKGNTVLYKIKHR